MWLKFYKCNRDNDVEKLKLKNHLRNNISSNLDVNIMSARSLDREKYFLSYDITLFMNIHLVSEISLFS